MIIVIQINNDNHDNDNTYDGEDEPFSLWQSVAEVFEAIKEIPCRDAMIALLLQQRRVTKQFNSIVILKQYTSSFCNFSLHLYHIDCYRRPNYCGIPIVLLVDHAILYYRTPQGISERFMFSKK